MWTQRVNQDERDAETSIIELPMQQHGTRGLALQRQDGRPAARAREEGRETHTRTSTRRTPRVCLSSQPSVETSHETELGLALCCTKDETQTEQT